MRLSAAGCCRSTLLLAFISTPIVSAALAAGPALEAPTKAAIAHLGVPFVANQGQTDPAVAFVARTFAGTVFVTHDGRVVYSLRTPRGERDGLERGAQPNWSMSETFAGQRTPPLGLRAAATRVSDFVGGGGAVRTSLATFERVGLGEVAPGIEAELRATGNNVEKLFTVAPGADPAALKVRIAGATKLALDTDGSLIVRSGAGAVAFTAPIAYQDHAGQRSSVDVRYALDEETGEYGFVLGPYNRALALVIDPLLRSTYSGGAAVDSIRAMLVHPGSGQVYVAGVTSSADFPGASSPKPGTGTDAFVARYSAGLTTLQLAAYYGGNGEDSANAIGILTSSGDIYVAGRTSSTSGLLNIAGNNSGGNDAFIVRFDGALSTVIGATYFGGAQEDGATGLAVDTRAGEIVVVGDTRSATLPVGGSSPAQGTPGGGQDGFVARFNTALGLVRTSFIGGSADDQALAVAIDPVRSDVYVAGSTLSMNFPGVANGAFTTHGGLKDGFVARFNSSLTTRDLSTYFGGTADDQISAIALHPINSHVYVTGDTLSTNLRGRLVGQTTKDAGTDAFVARFYPELSGLHSVTYFGSGGEDLGTAIAINPATGEVYVAGSTTSSALPGVGFGVQTANAAPGTNDAFVARFDSGLTAVRQSTLLGGVNADSASALSITDTTVYIAGSTGFPFPGIQPISAQEDPGGGASDGFISAMTSDLRALSSNPSPFSFTPVVNALPLTVQTSAPVQIIPNGNATVYVDGQPGSTWCASTGPNCTCDLLPGNLFTAGTQTLTATLPYYVCVRQISGAAPGMITEATLHIAAMAAPFRVGTGLVPGFGCTLDADGNGILDALTDGLIMIRALFGLTGTSVTNGAIGNNPTRSSWSDISAFFNANCGTNFAP